MNATRIERRLSSSSSHPYRGLCLILVIVCGIALACEESRTTIDPASSPAGSTDRDAHGRAAPTEHTRDANAAVLTELPFEDERDFENAQRGFIAKRTDPVIRGAGGKEVWNLDDYEFISGPSPASVHPSLWRQARLNAINGLFEVIPGIYQVRGYDLANMTIIVGETGFIIIDPMTTFETSSAAMELVREHLGDKPVTGLMYTHSHIDHFGGARGVLSDEDIERGVPVIAPEGFVLEAVSENVLAGAAMTRRASYMFGFLVERSERGHVDSGLGKASTPGSFGLAPPNRLITETGSELTLDGIRFVFQNTPGAEAPAEMMIYLPDMKALCGAENVSHVLHNVLTLRGAKVRDALLWSNYIDETIRMFGDAQVLFASHHWPTWGNAEIIDYLKKQRDVYKYIHDQTLRLANQGLTPKEIAEVIELPKTLRENFATRGYYGTVSHNSKAVYQHYFGWYDGNPANLEPLPPVDAAERYVAAMGGAASVVELAQEAYAAGDYRWVAELLNHVIFAEPAHEAAAALLADAYDQLGYQSESGPWRDFYLTGAQELRRGIEPSPIDRRGTAAIISAIPTPLFFDALAVRLNGAKAEGEDTVINFVFTDTDESYVIELENAVLHHREGAPSDDADATLHLTRATWNEIIGGAATPASKLMSGDIEVDGNPLALAAFFSLLDPEPGSFEIVRP